jgi:NAD(P)-dependent dehydrogenase (short-subunit alcohol dehydrogenase family)
MEGLEGKTALVAGGADGIGSTIGEALLESGGRVFLHDLPTSDGAAKARSLCQRFGDGRRRRIDCGVVDEEVEAIDLGMPARQTVDVRNGKAQPIVVGGLQ